MNTEEQIYQDFKLHHYDDLMVIEDISLFINSSEKFTKTIRKKIESVILPDKLQCSLFNKIGIFTCKYIKFPCEDLLKLYAYNKQSFVYIPSPNIEHYKTFFMMHPKMINKYRKKIKHNDLLEIIGYLITDGKISCKTLCNAIHELDHDIQSIIVKQNGNNIRYLKNVPEKVKIEAVKSAGFAIRWIEDPSFEVQKASIYENYYALDLIKTPYKAIQEKALLMSMLDGSEMDIIKLISDQTVLFKYIKKDAMLLLDLKSKQINLELLTIGFSQLTQENRDELILNILRDKTINSEILLYIYDFCNDSIKNKIKKHKNYKTIAQMILNKIKDQD